jgi:hypothetical protein
VRFRAPLRPSLNKYPKWLPQLAQTISCHSCVFSKTYLTFPGMESSKEDGQPQCASNFELLSNNSSEQAPQQ